MKPDAIFLKDGIKVHTKSSPYLTFATLDDYDNFCWDMLTQIRFCSNPTDKQLDAAKRLSVLVTGGAYDK